MATTPHINLRIEVQAVDVACDACGTLARLASLEWFPGWTLSHRMPRMVVIHALVNGQPQQWVPRAR